MLRNGKDFVLGETVHGHGVFLPVEAVFALRQTAQERKTEKAAVLPVAGTRLPDVIRVLVPETQGNVLGAEVAGAKSQEFVADFIEIHPYYLPHCPACGAEYPAGRKKQEPARCFTGAGPSCMFSAPA